jgi:hypothetical protein
MRKAVLACICLIGMLGASPVGAAPNHLATRLQEPVGRGIGAFSTIEIVTRWDSAGYRIRADFSALDALEGGQAAVLDSANGSYRISYTTGSMEGLADTSGLTIPITATSRFDPSSTFTYRGFVVCRNARTPLPVFVGSEPDSGIVRFEAGQQLWIRSRWRVAGAPGFRVTADYRTLVPDFSATEVRVDSVDTIDGVTEYLLKYKIPGKIRLVPDGNDIPLTIVGRDDLCTEMRDSSVRIDLRTGTLPAPIEHALLAPVDRGVRNGDTVRISSRWDSTTVDVRADFTALDGGLGSQAVVHADSGRFEILYNPVAMDAFEDDVVRIPITGSSALGDSFTDNSMTIARNLRTPPPRLLAPPWIESEQTTFHPTDELIIVSRWESPTGEPFAVEALLSNLILDFQPKDATASFREPDEYVISYRIPAKEHLAPDGRNIRIGVLARDTLNSVTRSEELFVNLDSEAPEDPPIFDPLPAETNRPLITVSGTAVAAFRVALVRDNVLRLHALVDTLTDRFSGELELAPGPNKIGGWSEDEVGNKTVTGTSQIVRYITGRATVYNTPFRPGEEIQVNDGAGMREATVTIFNLEGDALVRLEKSGSFFEARLRWDGRDANGETAQPGYYLMRVERVSSDGHASDEVLPMLLRHD